MVRDLLTDVLDVVGLAAVAVGLGMAAASVWTPLGPLAGGVALIGGVQFAEWVEARKVGGRR